MLAYARKEGVAVILKLLTSRVFGRGLVNACANEAQQWITKFHVFNEDDGVVFPIGTRCRNHVSNFVLYQCRVSVVQAFKIAHYQFPFPHCHKINLRHTVLTPLG